MIARVTTAVVEQRQDADGVTRYALVSKDRSRVLQWFGKDPPTDEQVEQAERRVRRFANIPAE